MPDDDRLAEDHPIAFARRLRRSRNVPEMILWRHLRANRFYGENFRRQDPVGPYVADFACRRVRLAVEIDGASHDGRPERDAERDRYLASEGWRVLRIPAVDVYRDIESVLIRIRSALEAP